MPSRPRSPTADRLYARFRLMIDPDGVPPVALEGLAAQVASMPDRGLFDREAQLEAWVRGVIVLRDAALQAKASKSGCGGG